MLGLLIRTRGGALKLELVGHDYALSEKQRRHFKQKQLIGKKASQLIRNGEIIILDSGITTTEIARNLSQHSGLTIISNALNIASILAPKADCKVIMLGRT